MSSTMEERKQALDAAKEAFGPLMRGEAGNPDLAAQKVQAAALLSIAFSLDRLNHNGKLKVDNV